MQKIKHTKNELKRQKDALKRFLRYLPTLMLKKQQLQMETAKVLHALGELELKILAFNESVHRWVAVFAEEAHIEELVGIEKVEVSTGNIAGIDIPLFEKAHFWEKDYDYVIMPLWVDYGVEAVKGLISLKAEYRVLEKQLELVREELRITTQRVNLFEKVMIPRASENIRKIRIFLGDLETAAVVTGKIAKKKLEEKLGVFA